MKNWLMNFALILISINIVSFAINRNWNQVSVVFELLFVTLMIRLIQILTNKFSSRYPILEYMLEFAMVTAIVFGFGWLFGWIGKNWWHLLIVIIIVYAAAYVLDLTRTKRDISFINEQIKIRRLKSGEIKNDR
jgi:hypothetical protein